MQHLDLTNLRDATGGDGEMERELFRMFLESGEASISELATLWQAGKEDLWREQAHAFKGAAYNLGAGPLGEICKEAQESFAAPPEKKRALLDVMQAEFSEVRAELEKLLAA